MPENDIRKKANEFALILIWFDLIQMPKLFLVVLANIVCVIFGLIQTVSKCYLSLHIDYCTTYFSNNLGSWQLSHVPS